MPVVNGTYYSLAPWVNQKINLKKYIVLSKESTREDAQLFLSILFEYNNIDIDINFNKALADLLNEDDLLLGGGILFSGNKKIILPSCCCGLESWRDILDDVLSRKSPWMGHDPYPTIEYLEDNIVRIWPDNYIGIQENILPDELKHKIYYIDYFYDDLICSLEDTEKHLYEFAVGPLYKWLREIDEVLAKKVSLKFCKWFDVTEC